MLSPDELGQLFRESEQDEALVALEAKRHRERQQRYSWQHEEAILDDEAAKRWPE